MHKRGALTAIYSGYPWFKLRDEGLPRQAVRTFPYLHAPYMRLAPRFTPARLLWEWQDRVWFDRHVARTLPSCDLFCGLSGSGLRSGRVAKSRGAKYVCDRGSTHIRVQDHILREEHDRQGIRFSGIDPRVIEREEAEYETADVITIPSTFALRTFVESGVSRQKLRLVPYGVDLHAFYSCAQRKANDFHILFVGAISVRKGVRYLVEAFRQLECKYKRLTLVGSVSPEMQNVTTQMRDDPRINITGHVRQYQLKEIMSTSHVIVLPSVEDGFGLVQAQAMACGCPVIASQNTGAHDLFTDSKEGFIVPSRDSGAIASRLQQLADNPELRLGMSEAALQRVKSLGGWEQYGETMYRIFSEAISS
jgi:alpha-maltose-1-phosphate synthase